MEIWKPIAGFDGKYEVSNFGNVKALACERPHWCGKMIAIPESIVKQSRHSGGYRIVSLRGSGKHYVHRLVMAVFTGEQRDKDVNHIDGDKSNNSLNNLEYCDRLHNVRHAIATGLQDNSGENNGGNKYAEQQIKSACRLVSQGMSQAEAARKSGVKDSTIHMVLKGKRWKHLALATACLFLMIGTLPAQVLLISPQPTLAPACECVECKCDPCKCVKPVVSVMLPKQVSGTSPAQASVQVAVTKGKVTSRCSGTAIGEHLVATCWHAFSDGGEVTINGKPAKLLRFDKASDVALVVTDDPLKYVPVASQAPAKGEPVTAYGFEASRTGLFKFPSRINATNRYRGFPNVSILGRPQQGRSGGGLFNERGELVGVCSAADGNEGLYCGLAAITNLLYPTVKDSLTVQPLKKPLTVIDPLKYSAPDFNGKWMQDPACPSGTCPPIKKPARVPSVQGASGSLPSSGPSLSKCPGNVCGQTKMPSRSSSYRWPVQPLLFRSRR